MNTFIYISLLHTLSRKISIGVVSLVIFVAPLFAFPATAAAETTDPALEQQTQSTEQNPDTTLPNPSSDPTPPEQQPAIPVPEPQIDETPLSTTPATLDNQSSAPFISEPIDSGLQSAVDATVENTLESNATSGDSSATSNTTVGDVSSGNSGATTTNMTLLQSSIGLTDNALPLVFTYDIVGDVTGDILIDPSAIDTSTTMAPTQLDSTPIPIDAELQAVITNNLALSATSGNATATANTTAGDILTGNAHVVANVVNIINSAIMADQSFIGTINIYGNLDGDILIPAELISTLLGAQNTPPELLAGGSIVTTVLNATIANNILSSATSGDVSAIGNSLTGDITSGESMTNVTILNLTGKQTITSNMLLVFVNVLGTWTGLIFDAPAGTTTASLGGGGAIEDSNQGVGPYMISSESNLSITNNLDLAARSGDATAIDNSVTGNIRSGNATTSANILNIINSHISLSNWFGILFINVFGTWNGNLAAAPKIVPEPVTTTNTETASAGPPQVFTFTAAATTQPRRSTALRTIPYIYEPASTQAVASDSTLATPKDISLVAQTKVPPTQYNGSSWLLVGGVLLAAGIIGTRFLTNRELGK